MPRLRDIVNIDVNNAEIMGTKKILRMLIARNLFADYWPRIRTKTIATTEKKGLGLN